MSKKANPLLVGSFSLGALIILVVVIMVFGSDRFLRKTTDYALYFRGSVSGLDVGAPVIFRGVKIGAVKEITLVYDAPRNDFRIPVVVEVYKGSAAQVGGKASVEAINIGELVSQGLRAQLTSQSLLTGKLSVSLDFFPDSEARMVADESGLPQIPTIPTALQAFSSKLESLPLEEIVHDLRSAMQGISELVNAETTTNLLKNLDEALLSTRRLMDSVNTEVLPLAKSVGDAAKSAQESLDAATAALQNIAKTLDANSALRYEVNRLVVSMQDAARGISELTSSIEKQPESLLKGKNQEERYK